MLFQRRFPREFGEKTNSDSNRRSGSSAARRWVSLQPVGSQLMGSGEVIQELGQGCRELPGAQAPFTQAAGELSDSVEFRSL